MISLPNPLQSTALARPEHIVLITPLATYTASELLAAVRLYAAKLQTRYQVNPHDLVAIYGPAEPPWVIALQAVWWLGSSVLPLSNTMHPSEISRALKIVRPRYLLTTEDLPPLTIPPETTLINHNSLLKSPRASYPPERFWPLDERRLVLLTSGSTAKPKIIELTTAQICFNALGSLLRSEHHLQDRWLLCLPLQHIGGLSILIRAAFSGTTVHLLPKFHPEQIAKLLLQEPISLVSLVPQMLERLLASATCKTRQRYLQKKRSPTLPFFNPRLRLIFIGGAPLPPTLSRQAKRWRLPLAITWGMTETASQITMRRFDQTPRMPKNQDNTQDCGPPLAFSRVQATRTRTTKNSVLRIQGPIVNHRYTSLLTKDCGFIDECGAVQVTGRQDNMFFSAGKNVVPEQIEQILKTHPQVQDIAIISQPARRWGAVPLALCVPKKAPPWSKKMESSLKQSLRSFAKTHLAPYQRPYKIVFVPALPKSSLGKLQRSRLKELLQRKK